MEMIKISSTKLKIMLSEEDMRSLDFNPVEREDISCRAGFRNILREARDRCGFDAVGERVFVQYYPEKHGGCEMFVTKLDNRHAESGRQMYKNRLREHEKVSDLHEEYIIYAYGSLDSMITTCGRLMRAGYSGESLAYRINEVKTPYFLVLNCHVLYAGEDGGKEVNEMYKLFLTEHGRLLCKNAVDCLGKLV